MRVRLFLVLIFLLISLNGISTFGRRRSRKSRRGKDFPCGTAEISCEPAVGPENAAADVHRNCSFDALKKISDAKSFRLFDSVDVNFSSACVRCGICLAIAEKINETLLTTHEMMNCNIWLSDKEADILLRAICDESFHHYALREIEGKGFICDKMPGAKLVSSSADGLWQEKLRNTCHEYLDEIGTVELYKLWRKWCETGRKDVDLKEILCRNDVGILRDCKNMDILKSFEKAAQPFHASRKITGEYDC